MTPDEAREFCREWGPFRAAPWQDSFWFVVAGDGDVVAQCQSSNAAHLMGTQDYCEAVAWALNEAGGHNGPIVQPPIPLPQPPPLRHVDPKQEPNRDGLRPNQSRALCCLRATCRAVQEAREEGRSVDANGAAR